MDWFQELTGLPDDQRGTVQGGVRARGDVLVCPNGRRLRAGRVSTKP